MSIASAWYTRRSALAAEGPAYPGVEVSYHGWDNSEPGWYRLDFVLRNRTLDAWQIISAKTGLLMSTPIISTSSRPYTGEDYNPQTTPLNDIPEADLRRTVSLGISVGPLGTQHFHGHGGDVSYFSLFVRPAAFSRMTNRLCISLILEAKTESVRHRDIAVTRRLKPRIITPA